MVVILRGNDVVVEWRLAFSSEEFEYEAGRFYVYAGVKQTDAEYEIRDNVLYSTIPGNQLEAGLYSMVFAFTSYKGDELVLNKRKVSGAFVITEDEEEVVDGPVICDTSAYGRTLYSLLDVDSSSDNSSVNGAEEGNVLTFQNGLWRGMKPASSGSTGEGTDTELREYLDKLFQLRKDANGNEYINTPYSFASEKTVSSLGVGEGGEGGGGGASYLYQLADVESNGAEVAGAVEGYSLVFKNGKWQGVKVEADLTDVEGKIELITVTLEDHEARIGKVESSVGETDKKIAANTRLITELREYLNSLFAVVYKEDGTIDYVRTPHNFASDKTVSSLGVGSDNGGGGVSYDRLDNWDNYVEGDGSVLSSDLGYGLLERIIDLEEGTSGDYASIEEKVNKNTNAITNLSTSLNDFLTGVDVDDTINRWKELEKFLEGYTETATLADLLKGKVDTNVYNTAIGGINETLGIHGTAINSNATNIASINTTLLNHNTRITDNANAINEIEKTLADWFTLENGVLHSKYGLASDKTVSSLGVGSDGGGGVSYNRLDSWDSYTADKAGYVLSAALGWDLKTRLDNLDLGDFDLSGYLTKSEAQNTYATIESLNSFASKTWVSDNYINRDTSSIYIQKFENNVFKGGLLLGSTRVVGLTSGESEAWILDNATGNATFNGTLQVGAWSSSPLIALLSGNTPYVYLSKSSSAFTGAANIYEGNADTGFLRIGLSTDNIVTYDSSGKQTAKISTSTGEASFKSLKVNDVVIGSLAFKNNLVASDIPSLSWNKITSDKPTTLSGYGITDGVPMPSKKLYYYDLNTLLTGDNPAAVVPYFQCVGVSENVNDIGSARKGVIRLYGGGSESQLVFDHYTGTIYYRHYGASIFSDWKTILDSSNFSNYALPLIGGQISGNLTVSEWLAVQDVIYAHKGLEVSKTIKGIAENDDETWSINGDTGAALFDSIKIGSSPSIYKADNNALVIAKSGVTYKTSTKGNTLQVISQGAVGIDWSTAIIAFGGEAYNVVGSGVGLSLGGYVKGSYANAPIGRGVGIAAVSESTWYNVTGLAFFTNNGTSDSADQFTEKLRLTAYGSLIPKYNTSQVLGNRDNRWSYIYSVNGDFSGSLTVANSVTIGDAKIWWDATNKVLRTNVSFASDKTVSSLGVGTESGGGGTGGYASLDNVASDVLPSASNTFTIGNSSRLWKAVYANSLYLGTTNVGDSISSLQSGLSTANGNIGTLNTRVTNIEGGYAKKATTLAGYGITDALPLSGGTVYNANTDTPLEIRGNDEGAYIAFKSLAKYYGYIGVRNDNTPYFYMSGKNHTLIHSGNIGSYALPLSGGTMSGVVTLDHYTNSKSYISFKNNRVGSGGFADSIINIKDGNNSTVGSFGMYGTTGVSYYYLGHSTYDGDNLRVYADKVTFGNKTVLHAGNIRDYALPNKYIESEPTESGYGLWGNVGAYLSAYFSSSYNLKFRVRSGGALQLKTQAGNGVGTDWSTIIHEGNIGSQSVSYANSAGNSDMLGNFAASRFLRSLTRTDVGVSPNFDNPTSPMIFFERRSNDETPNQIGTPPPANFVGVLSLRTADNIAMIQLAGSNYQGWYIRGKQAGGVTLEGTKWQQIATIDSNVASASYATSAGNADNATRWNGFKYYNEAADYSNTNPYFKLVTIRIKGGYVNSVVSFDVSGRSKGVAHVEVYFAAGASIGIHYASSVAVTGSSVFADKIRAYTIGNETDSSGNIIAKVIEVWYTKQSESYDSVVVQNVHWGLSESVEINCSTYSSLPTSYESYVDATMGSIYGSITKLTTPRTIWGQNFDGSGNVSGNLVLGNANGIKVTDTTGKSRIALLLNSGNTLLIGQDVAKAGYDTVLYGNTIKLAYGNYGTSAYSALVVNSSGNVTIGSSDLATTNYKLYVNGKSYVNGTLLVTNGIGLARNDANYVWANGGSSSYLLFGVNNVGQTSWANASLRITTVGNVEISKSLTVSGTSSFNGDLTVNANQHVQKVSGCVGIAMYAGLSSTVARIDVVGTDGNWAANAIELGATGDVKMYHNATILGDTSLSKSLTVQGIAELQSGLDVIGLIQGLDSVGGDTTWKITSDGSATVKNITVGSNERIQSSGNNFYIGNANNAGWVGMQDICSQDALGDSKWSIRTDGRASFSSTLKVAGATTLSSTLGVTGVATFNSNIKAKGYIYFGTNDEAWIYWDAGKKVLRTNVSFASDKTVSSLGVGSESGGGGSADWGAVPTDILPISDDYYNIGSPSLRFSEGHFNNVYADAVEVGSCTIYSNGNASFGSLSIGGADAATQTWVNTRLASYISKEGGAVSGTLTAGTAIYTGEKTAAWDGKSGAAIMASGNLVLVGTNPHIYFGYGNATTSTSSLEAIDDGGFRIVYNMEVFTSTVNKKNHIQLNYNNTRIYRLNNDASGMQFQYGTSASGVSTKGTFSTSGAYSASSDITKKNILSYNAGFNVHNIAEAPIAYFTWKDLTDNRVNLGSIAQYWQLIAPECIYGTEGIDMTMDYSTLGLVSSIINARAIVSHENEIEKLKRRVEELESENKRLQERVDALVA